MAAPFVFVTAVALTLTGKAPQAFAEDPPPPVEETFKTADGVQLHGLFLKSDKNPGTDPVVIMIYPPGKDRDMKMGDWKGLAPLLAKEGYNVFRFDWRGHGKSTDIKDTKKFWDNSFTGAFNNKLIKGSPAMAKVKAVIKNDLKFKDLTKPDLYLPAYVLDLAAARHHLDTKNDTGDVNMSSVYLIGSESAATIGMAWLASEWNRPATAPTPNQLAAMGGFPTYTVVPQPLNGGLNSEAGADITGAIWLSASRPKEIDDKLVKAWVTGLMDRREILPFTPQIRDNNKMLFLSGQMDANGKKQSDFFYNEVLVAEPKAGSLLKKLDQTFQREVKATNLVGVNLLGDNAKLGTEEDIIKFMAKLQAEKAKIVRKQRGFTSPWFVNLTGPNSLGFAQP